VATKLRRTALSLDAKTDAALAKLSALQRRPKATIAAELLSEMTPALERIAALLEAAMRNRARLPAETASQLQGLEDLLGHTSSFALDRLAAAVDPEPKRTGKARVAGHRGRRKH
jgi:hypothetical protein